MLGQGLWLCGAPEATGQRSLEPFKWMASFPLSSYPWKQVFLFAPFADEETEVESQGQVAGRARIQSPSPPHFHL